ncbi:origin recognition complex subunit 1 [Paragonimus westermani]|uniref:Origin recognition complex subunit 1 n=1 Tax=Paragonimus westermani TaxID=34504 RepID=A0A5J4NKV0_9TREM|nr:origin recognition complex subunit 1 [Paragonimus westermani]
MFPNFSSIILYASEDQQSDYHVESSTSSNLSVTASEPAESSYSESSDCESPASWIRRRPPRGRSTKWNSRSPKTPELRPKTNSASRAPNASHCILPRRTFSARPSNRTTSVCAGPHNGECLPGREHEFDSIYTFISGKLLQNTGGYVVSCMYISGLPGTGKTASVNAVLSAMTDAQATFQKIVINGMQVNDPKQVYIHILKQLTGTLATARQAAQILESEFCAPHLSKSRRAGENQLMPVVLVIDELDLLCTRRQDVLYNLFDWPTRPRGRRSLIVLAIANTMDLPERLLHPRVASRLGLTRLTFAPYSHEQLVSIVHSRLSCSLANSFQEKALELAARKVAAVSGDVRRALDICRRAAEMVAQSKSSREIGITHINAALKEMFTTPKLTAIRACSIYEKLFLRALIAEFQARSSEEARLNRCIQQMCALCRLEGFACPTTSEVFDICASLGAHKLLLTEASKRDTSMFVRLNCSKADVLFALKPRAGMA